VTFTNNSNLTEIWTEFQVFGNTKDAIKEDARTKAEDFLGEGCQIDNIEIEETEFEMSPSYVGTVTAFIMEQV
jgi:hypothetical protein